MKNIVAAVDFSRVSINAARYAVKLAEFYKADVWIYHCYQLSVAISDIGYPFVSAAELRNLADFEMEELVKDLQGISKQPVNIKSRVELVSLSEGLHGFCDGVKTDMLVMGITGKSPLQRLLAGSNTIYAIQHFHYPVLVVPGRAAFSVFRKIGMAVDYEKPVAPATINFVNAVIAAFDANLYIVNVAWNNHHTDTGKQQQELMHEEFDAGCVDFRTLRNEHVATAIHDFVEYERIDLLITLPKKHNLVEKLFSTAHTPALLYHTDIPVLCIPE